MSTVGAFATAAGVLLMLIIGSWALSSLVALIIAARLRRTNAPAGDDTVTKSPGVTR